jgi:hypothetical protein
MKAVRMFGVATLAMGLDACSDPAAPDTCISGRAMAIGGAVSGRVAAGDCLIGDKRGDSYSFLLPVPTLVRLNISGDLPVDLAIKDLARSVDSRQLLIESGVTGAMYVALPAGIFTVEITMSGAKPTSYAMLATSVTASSLTGCISQNGIRPVYVVPQASLEGLVAVDDCLDSSSHFVDYVGVYMPANQSRRISVSGSAGMSLAIYDQDPAAVAGQSSDVAGSIALRFTPSHSGFYRVAISAKAPMTSASYSVFVE